MTKRSAAGRARARAAAASYPADLRAQIVEEAEATYEYLQRTGRPRWLSTKLRVQPWLARRH